MAKEVAVAKLANGSLRKWNRWLAAAFFVQAVAILVASAARMYPVTIGFLGIDTLQTQAAGHTVLATGTHHLFDLNLAYVVAAFLLVAAVAHVLAATKLRPAYEQGLKRGANKIRWIEYVFAAGLMVVAIGLVAGVQDISMLIALFGLTAVAGLMGLAAESTNRPRLAFAIGCVAGGLAWLGVAMYLIGSVLYGDAPAYTGVAFGITLLLFIAGGVNLYLQQRKVGDWANYLHSEKMFMILSLITKTVLAWLLFAAVLHP